MRATVRAKDLRELVELQAAYAQHRVELSATYTKELVDLARCLVQGGDRADRQRLLTHEQDRLIAPKTGRPAHGGPGKRPRPSRTHQATTPRAGRRRK